MNVQTSQAENVLAYAKNLNGGNGAEKETESVTITDLSLDWDEATGSSRPKKDHADSIGDGLILSLVNLNRVDLDYISAVTGAGISEIISELRGSIYQNPETWGGCESMGWETADEYLSGNLLKKLSAAMNANRQFRGAFEDNINALKGVLPPSVRCEDIFVTLGSPWIPAKYIDEFIFDLIESGRGMYRFYRSRDYLRVHHDANTGTWEVPCKQRYSYGPNYVKANSVYGTSRINALQIIEKSLNMSPIKVTDEISAPRTSTGTKRVVNRNETLLAIEKQNLILRKFREWIWNDPKRKKELLGVYEEYYGCIRRRTFNGSFLKFPGMSPDVKLYDYQKDAVARILFSPNTLLAHDVGSGKTYVMIAAGMEMRRTGVSVKNLYVVPNNLTGQWKQIFLSMYPEAKLIMAEPKDFRPEEKQNTLRKIRDNDYDAVIMAYSCFDSLEISKKLAEEDIREKLDKMKAASEEDLSDTRAVRNEIKKLKKALAEVQIGQLVTDRNIYFDELGITTLFVDEAHNYKNLTVTSGFSGVNGISSKGSKKCDLMYKKVQCIQRANNGGGVVFATGTPITNSISDIFVMQKYLQGSQLALLDIGSFDAWIGMFAETREEFEIDVDTRNYRLVQRFSQFHNLPELTSLISFIADFHAVDESAGIPDFDGYDDVVIPRTSEFEEYLRDISARVESVRKGTVSRNEDNMLKITSDGRKAALDLRLALVNASFKPESKVMYCANNIYEIWSRTADKKYAQLVFCDVSTPKQGFNIYDELTRILVILGIPREEIAYVHDASTDRQREALFSKVRSGKIRVLVGSTFKLGLGVNVQDKLVALHHIDVPWRPADMVQREGRILRSGNTCGKVHIFRYITQGSFDAYSWQLLETKQRFICDLLSGSMTERTGSEVSDTVLSYGEIKALAIGNPLIKERVEAVNRLNRLRALQLKYIESRQALQVTLSEIPAKIKNYRDKMEKAKADSAFVKLSTDEPLSAEDRKEMRVRLFNLVKSNEMQPHERIVAGYRGFKVILPAGMVAEKPYLWLEREGRYTVDVGDVDTGLMTRLDNRIDGLDEIAENYRKAILSEKAKAKAIRAELSDEKDFSAEIGICRNQVEYLDKKLGVKDE